MQFATRAVLLANGPEQRDYHLIAGLDSQWGSNFSKRKTTYLMRGLCPRALGIIAFGPEWLKALGGRLDAARHSRPGAGARVAPLRCPTFRPGVVQYVSVHSGCGKTVARCRRAGYK
jgi:hypothetical protein